jgi:hypothetical protein
MYEWIRGGDIADVPQWVMEKMGAPWVARQQAVGNGRGHEYVGADDEGKPVSEDQVIRMLEAIDPDGLTYDEWLQVGQAINTQHPGDGGLKIWDNWCRRGSRYKNRECSDRWNGFDGTGNIRMGTLIFFAKQSGWAPKPSDTIQTPMDEMVAEMNQQYGLVQVGGKVKIIRERKKDTKKSHVGQVNFDLLDRDSFGALFANQKLMVVNPATGKAAQKTKAEVWMAHHARRTYEEGIGLFPNDERPGYFNVWQDFAFVPKAGSVQPFLDHVLKIICNNNEDHAKWVLDWCAYAVQCPTKLAGTAIVLRGQEGSGKGIFANTFGELWGAHFLHMIDEHHLTTNFNHHLLNSIVVFADEVVWGGNKKSASKLKGMVTENFMVYELKGVDAFSGPNLMHLIMATNEEWAVPAGSHSRRWFVLDVNNSKTGNMEYWRSFIKWRDHGGYEALLHFFKTRPLSETDIDDLSRAPETLAVSEQRAMSAAGDSVTAWWMELLEKEANGFRNIDPETGDTTDEDAPWANFVVKPELYDIYIGWCESRRIPHYSVRGQTSVYSKLLSFGAEGTKSPEYRVKKGKKRQYFMVFRDVDTMKRRFKEATGITIE